jgi:hypothetical protein
MTTIENKTEHDKAWAIDDEINQDRTEMESGPHASAHRVHWELHWDGTTTATIHCRSASKAPCRLHCPYNHVTCTCLPKELESRKECLAVEWFNAVDATECYQPRDKTPCPPRDGEVTAQWDSTIESWTWHYPTQGKKK